MDITLAVQHSSHIRSMTTEEPAVGVVLLNWNSADDTISCLKTLSEVKYPNMKTVVVDNDSSDDSADQISEVVSGVEILEQSVNKGFAGGCNVGINYFLERSVDHILLLNNDTEVPPDFLTPLVRTAENNSKVAAVGGVIRESDTGEIWCAGGTVHRTLAELDVHTSVQYPNEYQTEFLSGAMMLIPRNAINELGALNEDYFFGFEDQEYAHRASEKGWDLYVNPQSEIWHDVGGASGTQSPFKYYHSVRNRLHFADKNLNMLDQTAFYSYFLTRRSARVLSWMLLGRDSHDCAKAILLGVWDHLAENPLKKPGAF